MSTARRAYLSTRSSRSTAIGAGSSPSTRARSASILTTRSSRRRRRSEMTPCTEAASCHSDRAIPDRRRSEYDGSPTPPRPAFSLLLLLRGPGGARRGRRTGVPLCRPLLNRAEPLSETCPLALQAIHGLLEAGHGLGSSGQHRLGRFEPFQRRPLQVTALLEVRALRPCGSTMPETGSSSPLGRHPSRLQHGGTGG